MATATPTRQGLLAEVPEDVLFSILAHLEAARDMASLAGTCTRLARLVRDNGWRIFARTRFPSLGVPQERTLRNPELTWAMLSESLAWQSRCWDRRSLTLTATTQRRQPRGHQHQNRCPSVVDARFDLDSRSELLVWSEGESFCARRREIVDDGWTETHHFSRFTGGMHGFQAGRDDVMQLSIVDKVRGAPGRQGVLSLRASGRLDLRAAEHDGFGTLLASFDPKFATGGRGAAPEQSSLVSMDVSHKGSIAACNRDSLFLYHLPQDRDQPPEVGPYLACRLKELLLDRTDTTHLGGVKWIGNDDTLALGVKGQYTSQLQFLQLTPTGAVQVHRAVEHPGAGAGSLRRQIIASSITPVYPPSSAGQAAGRPLVLAAYSDGTVRLQDLRSPTPWDAVYEDNVNPGSAVEHVLAWGGERFVAGGSADAVLRLFDLRWPRPYHHQRALPCRSALPYPTPPQPFASPRRRRRLLLEDPARVARCDGAAGVECTWHRLSCDLYQRPNCNLYYHHRRDRDRGGARPAAAAPDPPSCVRSLAKGSDLSPHFFVGVPGGFLEARLGSGGRDGGGGGDPHLSFELLDLPVDGEDGESSGGGDGNNNSNSNSSGYETAELATFVMETGDGLSVPHNDRTIALPPFRPDARRRAKKGHVPQELQDSHRLDPRYHHVTDFGQFLTWNGSYGTVAE
ncbi:hypothetical protein RB594_001247 [Gaeumannomyces avenae]